MKKYSSVLSLFVRSSFYKVLAVILIMTAAEAGAFYLKLQKAIESFQKSISNSFPPVEQLISSSGMYWFFIAAVMVLSIFIWLPGCEFNEKTGYTLKRLSISEREVFLVQASYNIAVYLMLFLTQALVGFVLCGVYIAMAPTQFVSNQTIFLAFYRSPIMHSLVPLEEITLWVRNVFLIVTLGCLGAYFPYMQRRKKFPGSVIFLLVMTILLFTNREKHIGNHFTTFCMIFVSCCLLANSLYSVYRKEESEDE